MVCSRHNGIGVSFLVGVAMAALVYVLNVGRHHCIGVLNMVAMTALVYLPDYFGSLWGRWHIGFGCCSVFCRLRPR